METNYKKSYTRDCFFAALDIMGFKAVVDGKSPQEIYQLFASIVDETNTYLNVNETGIAVKAKIFSDSIFLVTEDGSDKSYSSIVIAAAHFQNLLFEQGYAVNGAISFGEVTYDLENDILFGKAVNDAHLQQEGLFFYGIVLHETAEVQQKKIWKGKIPSYYYDYPDLIIDENIFVKKKDDKSQSESKTMFFVNCCEKLVPLAAFADQKEAFKQLLSEYYYSNKGCGNRVIQYIRNTETVYKNWFDSTNSSCADWGERIIP